MIDLGLPDRPPFVFVRELVACDPGVSSECATTCARDNSMFVGHFPGNPLRPGRDPYGSARANGRHRDGRGAREKCRTTLFALGDSRDEVFSRIRPEERIVFTR
jgi:hypothetical protein